MSPEIERRLQALESQRLEGSDPRRIHRMCTELGLASPEPLPGETTQEWLPRVSRDTLRALIDWGDSHGLM